jgi:type II secretory pathway pseudopilin PulG
MKIKLPNRRLPTGCSLMASGFTMIEIAISLAVIGFALVAIIAILPPSMSVQRENREETIINQDETVLMNAVRNGEQGLDDLTNYVIAITNYVTECEPGRAKSWINGYSYFGSQVGPGASTAPAFRLTNGFRIIGLLSTPKYIWVDQAKGHFLSNHVVATIRSLSGPASEKFPQTNQVIQELSLNYQMIMDVVPYGYQFHDPVWTNFMDPDLWVPRVPVNNTNEITARSNYWILVRNFENSLHDVRMTFRWPLLVSGRLGPSRQPFRTMVSGTLAKTNELPPLVDTRYHTYDLYFFQPRTYVAAPLQLP